MNDAQTKSSSFKMNVRCSREVFKAEESKHLLIIETAVVQMRTKQWIDM